MLALPAFAQDSVVIAVVDDGPSDRLAGQQQKYIDELLALTSGEFDVQLRQFSGAWTRQTMEAAIESAYEDADIDMVLVTGFVSNQFAAIRSDFPKPTFLPIILDTGLLTDEPRGGVSGIHNLNYLSAYADFSSDLDTLARITDYQKLVLFVDANLSSAIPSLRQSAFDKSTARGVELLQVMHDGLDHELMNRVPDDTDAIFVAALPRMPSEDFDRLVESINSAGLPSYSFSGVTDVERGLLATNTEPKDIDRQARLNALNMQAVMLGGLAEEQPVASSVKDQLTINMATSRRIGLSLSFDVLSDSILLNQDEVVFGEVFGLVEIASLALAQNQDLLAESYGVQAGLEDISAARSNLLPQLGVSASHTVRNDSQSVSAGLLAERTSDAALSFDQLLYSDAASANLKIQKELQRTRLASLQQFRLDVIQVATTSYYQVLNARSQLDVSENNLTITRANLELAENRVRLGNSTAADVYRWQAEVARAQIEVLNARASLNQRWETLNRVLHRPQGERLVLRAASFDEPFVMTRKEFDQLIRSPADYAQFSRFYIERALFQAPELAQLDAQIIAKRRELTSTRRAYWLPDFSLSGRYTSNLSQSGLGAGSLAGEGLDDWNVGLQATLPLFSGGLKRANVSRAEFELRQLETLRLSRAERVEEEMRIQLHAAEAAYRQIDLTAIAAEASRKNFDLVSDAYARGTVTVIELLDAQDTSRAASAAAAESIHNFLITIMSLQRAVGGFDYMLSKQERDELATQFRATITGR
ncbi:MAG: TolC family protein [Woeseiaceae bacterium]